MTQVNTNNAFDPIPAPAPGSTPASPGPGPTSGGEAFLPSDGVDETGTVPGVDLSNFDADFDAAQAADLEEVPDSKYQVRVFSVKLAHSQKNDPMLKWDLVVISGQLAGRHVFKNSVITQASLPFVKGDLKMLGLQLGKFSDLPNRLPELLDLALEVTKRTKGEYTNVYFNKLLTIPPNSLPGGGIGHSGEPAPF